MSKRAKIILIVIAIFFIAALIWFGKKNQSAVVTYETEKPFKTSIEKKTVATGTVTPLEEIEIKPQITGIIDKILLLEGSKEKKVDLISTTPPSKSLESCLAGVQIPFNLIHLS